MIDVLANGPVALAVVASILLAAWCFSNRRVDRSLLILGLYLGLLDGYLKLRTGNSFITLGRDVLIAAIALGALLRLMHSGQRVLVPPLGGLVLSFAAIVLVEMFNPRAPGISAGLAGVRQHLEFVPLFFLGFAVMQTESRLRTFAIVLVGCAAIGGVVSYIQSTLTPEELARWGSGYRDRIYGIGDFAGAGRVAFTDDGGVAVRPFGLGSDMGGGALAAALAVPAFMGMLIWARGWLRAALVPASVGLALAVATSGSRAGLVIVFVSVLAFVLLTTTQRTAVRLVIGLAVGGVLIWAVFQQLGPENAAFERAKTVAPTKVVDTYQRERGASAAKVGEYAIRYPLGLGVGSVGPAGAIFNQQQPSEPLNVETLWNFLVLETGLPGLVVVLALLLTIMARSLARVRVVDDLALRFCLAAIAAPVFGLFAAGFAGPTTIGVPAGPYFWFAAGVLSYWLMRGPTPSSARPEPTVDARPGTPSAGTVRRSPEIVRA